MKKILFAVWPAIAIATGIQAQSIMLTSPCSGTFSRNSVFFDLQVSNNIVLDSLAILCQNCGTRDLAVYYKAGTYLGFNSNPAAWTLIDTAINFTPACAGACPIPPTVIPVPINLCLDSGQTYGFYLAMTSGTGTLETHNTLPSGSIAVQDANLKLITGEGHNGTPPFNVAGTLVTGLTMQGEFHYHLSSFSSFTLGNDTTFCTGDSVLLNAGTGYTSYLWSTGDTTQTIYVNTSGSYAVQVAGGGCISTDTILATVISCSGINANFFSSDTSFCEKQCIDFFDLSTNNPTSWQWFFPGSDSLTSTEQNPSGICYSSYGSFDVTLVACNASGCDTIFLPGFINEFQAPPVPVITVNADTLFSSAAFSYQWYDSNGLIPGATGNYYVYTGAGNYYVVITDSNGCAASSIVIPVGVHELSLQEIKITPNPSDGVITIHFSGVPFQNAFVEVHDGTGRLIKREKLSSLSTTIDLDMSPGIYFVTVQEGLKIFRHLVVIHR